MLVLIHGVQQAFEAVLRDELEAVHVRGALHTALQAIDLLTQLVVQFTRGAAVVGMPGTGLLQVALEGFQAPVELLQVGFEFMLAAVGDGQHKHGQVIEHRNQLVPVQPTRYPLAHGQRLCLMALR